MWKLVRKFSLELIRSVPQCATHGDKDLNNFILNTGYTGATIPHKSIGDFIYCYVRSLNNVGGGALPHAVAEMLKIAVAPDDKLMQSLTITNIAKNCLYWLEDGNLLGTDERTKVYRKELIDIIDVKKSQNTKISKLGNNLNSVRIMLEKLQSDYNGSPLVFVNTSMHPINSALNRNEHIFRRLHELLQWKAPGLGLAVTANFLKDVSAPRLREIWNKNGAKCPAAWFIKPDRHVLAVLTIIAGRGLFKHTADVVIEPNNNTALQGEKSFGDAILKVNEQIESTDSRLLAILFAMTLAHEYGVTGLEIDRIAYLIGSGKYINNAGYSYSLPGTVQERYRRLSNVLL